MAKHAFEIGTESGQTDALLVYAPRKAPLRPSGDRWRSGFPSSSSSVRHGNWEDFAPGLADMHASEGNLEEARRLLEQCRAKGFDFPLDFLWLNLTASCAGAAMVLGDQTSARLLYDKLAPFADMLPTSGASSAGPISFHLGGLAAVLANYDDADRHFEQSARFCERYGAKYFAAETSMVGEDARRARRSGGPQAGPSLLRAARSSAVTLGYGGIERRAADILQTLG